MVIRRWILVFCAVAAIMAALSGGNDDPLVPIDLTAGPGSDGSGSEGSLLVPAARAGVWLLNPP